jgi:hypothetical protein
MQQSYAGARKYGLSGPLNILMCKSALTSCYLAGFLLKIPSKLSKRQLLHWHGKKSITDYGSLNHIGLTLTQRKNIAQAIIEYTPAIVLATNFERM